MYPDQCLPRPDIVFQLDIEINKIKTREGFGNEIYEKEDFQKKIRKEFEFFHQHRYWRLIDADKEKIEVHRNIVDQLERLMKDYSSNENDDFRKNFYPYSIGEDLFMYKDF